MGNNIIEIKRTFFVEDIMQVENSLDKNILTLNNICEDILNELYHFYILRFNNNVAGYIVFTNSVDHVDLISVAIRPQFRNLGLAKKLIDHMENECQKCNLFPIFLEVRKSNIPAINLYKKLKYEQISTRKNYYKNPVEDAYIYMKNSPNI